MGNKNSGRKPKTVQTEAGDHILIDSYPHAAKVLSALGRGTIKKIHPTRLEAIIYLCNRVRGKPKATTEIIGDKDNPLAITWNEIILKAREKQARAETPTEEGEQV